MQTTIGKKISALRKERDMTQDELAEKLGVSPQAVSKWENDISCPDIMLLPIIAKLFETTTDELLSAETKKETVFLPVEQRKNIDDLMFKIIVNSGKGDRVRVNLPMPLVRIGLEMGMQIPQLSEKDYLKDINIEQILLMAEKGVIGKLVDVQSAEGDIVEIVVE